MATEEWIKRAIQNGKLYEDLPPRVRSVLPVSEWKLKVKEHCIQRGLSYDDSLANTSCQEQEYYEDLLRYYRYNYRLFPYHLSDYVCRVLRVTPFRYYCDLLFTVMREEKSYDQIPNFTAADIVRIVGIGRNEYIATMNKCKAKKLLWRMNKAVVKEHLPTEPLEIVKQPWWIAHVVNLGEVEFRSLAPTELAACTEAARPGGVRLRDADTPLIDQLHRRGLIYLEVPIRPDDHVSIPPLEGFVSNRDSERNEDKADPIEIILYAVFVATSARASVAELADILQVELPKLQAAISIACRLGFATRLPNPAEDEEYLNIPNMSLDFDLDSEQLDLTPTAARASSLGYGIASLAAEEIDDGHSGQGIALVVDAEVTSYLMMGALSPGLKRHSVTLFEEVISELIFELDASVEAASGFEGEMQRLAGYARALATSLRCIRASGGARPIELLRKESLAGLAPAAAARVLSHAYVAVVPIAPLPYPPLPLAPNRPGPTNFGPTAEAATPWVQLALYTAMRSGPVSVVFVCGQRLWRLPPQLLQCTHALLWPWNMDAVRAHEVPVVVEASFLLFSLNEYLSRTALLVQPLHLPSDTEDKDLIFVDIPLPLPASTEPLIGGIATSNGEVVELATPRGLREAVEDLGLQRALGYVRMLRLSEDDPLNCPDSEPQPKPPLQPQPPIDLSDLRLDEGDEGEDNAETEAPLKQQQNGATSDDLWVPVALGLGLPLTPDKLCIAVCGRAGASNFLDSDVRREHAIGQAVLQRRLFELIADYGACTNCLGGAGGRKDDTMAYVDLPIHNLLFDGAEMWRLDYTDFTQGVGTLCVE
ncbi:g3274 [Coccomyxa elongata]